jgi:hypothetical protein
VTSPGTIRKTILGGGDAIGDLDGFLRSLEEYAKLGVDLVDVTPVTMPTQSICPTRARTISP